ncbi:lysophospholipid acyltransferase family protein [Solitalea koreensis]|uniref:1-acyl-sn-glycerol-3-phosphate acyltransferase n=1 Tax=Solitalea koreensis TaxID=543615 RepID=A0A521AY89_9SPHI|nr:lysophospholipid acyltransferase family protein [Solitalea koreensis]SMO39759.1 1-acyl-sn-glycerol-3-phosphate acyltransferase [Solitalea koreensis]
MRNFLAILQLMIAGLVFVAVMIIVLPFIVLPILLIPGRTGRAIGFYFLQFWAICTSTASFIFFKSYHHEKAPDGRAYVYVLNHGSYLDAMGVVMCIKQAFRPLGKIEMTKVPVFGIIYKRVAVMIDRSSKGSRERSVQELKKELAQGGSILIFPEGTMNRTEKPLANFYDGAFRIAIETQSPIAPIAIINARTLMPRSNPFSIRPGLVKFIYDDVVETKGLTQDDLPELKKRIHQSMERIIISNESKYATHMSDPIS